MSLHPMAIPAIPEETARIARAAFPRGTTVMRLRDELGVWCRDADFADLFPPQGQPAAAPWQLALVLVLQFVDDLSDRQAADAVRGRIDWKYALSLELTDSGFDPSVLSEFRTRLVAQGAERRLLDTMLDRLKAAGLLRARGRQRTDSTHVLTAVRTLNRLAGVGETMRHALNVVAVAAPAWLREHVDPAWTDRYAHRFDEYRLPKEKGARKALAEQIGADGARLLEAVRAASAPAWLCELPAVETLRRVWLQQFYAGEAGPVRWRAWEDRHIPAGVVRPPTRALARVGEPPA